MRHVQRQQRGAFRALQRPERIGVALPIREPGDEIRLRRPEHAIGPCSCDLSAAAAACSRNGWRERPCGPERRQILRTAGPALLPALTAAENSRTPRSPQRSPRRDRRTWRNVPRHAADLDWFRRSPSSSPAASRRSLFASTGAGSSNSSPPSCRRRRRPCFPEIGAIGRKQADRHDRVGEHFDGGVEGLTLGILGFVLRRQSAAGPFPGRSAPADRPRQSCSPDACRWRRKQCRSASQAPARRKNRRHLPRRRIRHAR